jgi:hypothetical protein
MYKEGRQVVMDLKKEVDGVIKDVKGVKEDAKGIFGFLTQIFSPKKETKHEVQETPKKVKTKSKPQEFDENLIYQQVSDALIKFFQAYNGLKHYKEDKEAEALTVGGDEGNEIAIQLVIADLQMEKLNSELSDYMVYHVPAELKDLYTRVNQKIGHIANQQALARREELLEKRRLAWQRKQEAELIRNRVVAIVLSILVILWTWLTILSLTHSPSF